MPRLSINLTMLFLEIPFMERFAAVAQAGFQAVELGYFLYDFSPEAIRREVDKHGLRVVHLNLPPGDRTRGERGIANDPRRQEEFRASIDCGIRYAKALGVTRANCMSGLKLSDVPDRQQRQALVENFRYAAEALGAEGIQMMTEPLNSWDVPGFHLNIPSQVFELMEEVAHPNFYLQYDIYHTQRMQGELIGTLERHIDKIAHIQVADNPGRHQPGTGEINYRAVFSAIDTVGYTGYVGLEYIPTGNTGASFGWIREYGLKEGGVS
ncbi:MAG: TIM barrel protein [Negativicutes bacterium]|nr:TIM barrel protein [Negativicutes bacterium]MDR3592807.1 TIM barrel protein [Negativicutes bacterium]